MTNAELREQRVDRGDLQTGAPATVHQLGSVDVILSLRSQRWHGREAVDDVLAGAWPGKSLQQLLQDEPGTDNGLPSFQGVAQGTHLRCGGRLVAAKGEGPDAGVDEQHHGRPRSAL